jgi:phage baseplate assembly protein W
MSIQRLYETTTVKSLMPKDQPPLPRTYRGFSSNNSYSENFTLYDLSLIKQDLLNHFNIRQGEKLSDPTFGTIIWDIIFEPLTEDIKRILLENVTQIINYDPRVRADNIIVTAYATGIQIECELTYLPYNISENLQFRFDQSLGLIG